MRIIIIAAFLMCLYSVKSLAQSRIPVYVMGSGKLNLDSSMHIQVFQFFSDATFTLLNYHRVKYNIYKTATRGRYLKQGDTLFLKDAGSVFSPFTKEKNQYAALAKDEAMQLCPATIIIGLSGSVYISYLNIPHKIYSSNYWTAIELDKAYKKKQKYYEETRHLQY